MHVTVLCNDILICCFVLVIVMILFVDLEHMTTPSQALSSILRVLPLPTVTAGALSLTALRVHPVVRLAACHHLHLRCARALVEALLRRVVGIVLP